MMDASTRNLAREKQTEFANGIVSVGAKNIADKIGVHPSQITRWQGKDGVIEKACAVMAVIEMEMPKNGMVIFQGEETAELAKGLIEMLEHIRTPKEKTSAATEAI